MQMHNPDNTSVYYLLIGILTLIWFVSRNMRSKYRPRPARRLPLDMARLRWIAYRKSLLGHLLFVPPVAIIAVACYASGRMGIVSCLLMAIVLLFYPLIHLLIVLRLQRTPMQSLPQSLISEMDNLRGKELIYSGGAWGYADADWYICVGPEICAVLWAGCIDFSQPVRWRKEHWKGGSGRSGYRMNIDLSEFRLRGKNGADIIARTQSTPLLEKWIRKHGGRLE